MVVRNSVLTISHNTFRDCCVDIFSENLSRNSSIHLLAVALSLKIAKRKNEIERSQIELIRHILISHCRLHSFATYANLCLLQIKLATKTVDEDPASCKRWIFRKEIKSAKI